MKTIIVAEMKFYKIVIVLLIGIALQSCKIGRFVFYNISDITDYKIFPANAISPGPEVFHYPEKHTTIIPDTITVKINSRKRKESFNDFLKRNKTVAFLVIKGDSLEYERYFNKYDTSSIVASFSMAKSIVGILIGCAIDDNLIHSVNDPITRYMPELETNDFGEVTILDLLNMTSGVRFRESYYNPFSEAASFYYGRNLKDRVKKLKINDNPGLKYSYNSGNTQLLGMVLERVLNGRSISSYLQEKIWIPLGMEYDATWSLDMKSNGIEKTFCCLNARAKDFAKIGSLYLNKGNWNGKQIISKDWVNASTKVDTISKGVWFYRNQWWIHSKSGDFGAEGHNGQFIYVNPAKKLVIVRLGKRYGKIQNWYPIFTKLAAKY